MAKAAKKAGKKAAKAAKSAPKSSKKSAPKAAKKAAKKAAPKAAKKSAKRSGGTANAAFMAPLTPTGRLAEVIGEKPLPRTEIVKKMWDYIKKNDLQDKNNRRMINADEKLRALFGKDQVSMFDLAKIVNKNVK